MTAALMFNAFVVGGVLAAAASVAHVAERSAGRPVRWIWGAMLALTALLTLLAPYRVERAAPRVVEGAGQPLVLRDLRPAEQSALDLARAGFARARAALGAVVAPPLDVVKARIAAIDARMTTALTLGWIVSSGIAVVVFAGTYRRVRRAREAWPRERLHGTAVRLAPDAGPAVVGFRPMEIVLPRWILDRESEEQRLVLAHERAHVDAGDPWLLAAGCATAALMPWNPFVWYGLARLRLAIELDCDRRVLRGGASPRRYGSLLVDLSAHRSTLGAMLPALSYGTSNLERRLLAMTQRPARFTQLRRAGGAVAATIAVLAACESKLPTSAEVEALDAKSATAAASRLEIPFSSTVQYVVDDKKVSLKEAELIPSSKISAVEVVKVDARSSEIRLRTTRDGDAILLKGSKVAIRDDSIGAHDGVVERPVEATQVRLREVELPSKQTLTLAPSIRTGVPLTKSDTRFDGLFIIDGRLTERTELDRLAPSSIESIEVVKGQTAKALYSDPRAANGVIVVKTKR